MVEATFHATYGSPLIQALLGLRASDDPPRARPGREPEEIAFVQQRIAELEGRMGQGGLREAFVRAIIYIRLPELAADERGFAVLSKLREEHASDLSLADFKALVRDQFLMLELDEAQAVATIPAAAARPWRSGRQGFGAARERGDGARAAGPGGGAAPSSDRRAIHGCGRLDGGRRWRDPAAAAPADHRRWVRHRPLSGGRPGRHRRRQRSSTRQRSRGASVPTLTGSGTNRLDIPRPRTAESRLACRA